MLRKFLTVLALGVLLPALAAAQTVDEIIEKNLEAKGGKDAIQAVQSARFTGRMEMGQGMEAPIVLEWKRPDLVRMEFTLQGMTGIQAFDGETGWYIMPFLGKSEPQEMAEDELKQIREMADAFEGPLLNYEEKGHQVEYQGKEDVEGTPAHKLELTRNTGDVSTIYVDDEYFLEIKSVDKRTVRGQEIESETVYGDYKEVNGLLFPFSIQQQVKGAPQGQTITIDEVELGVELPQEHFEMPEPAPEEPATGNGG